MTETTAESLIGREVDLEAMWAAAEGIAQDEQFLEAFRRPTIAGPALDPPDGADTQTRLLAFWGRQAW